MSRLPYVFLLVGVTLHIANCQSRIARFAEDFDHATPPELPPFWSGFGFVVSASAPHSVPNAVAGTGNTGLRELTSPEIQLEQASAAVLSFWERRSATAAGYRLEVAVSADNFESLIASQVYDTLEALSVYRMRTLDLPMDPTVGSATVRIRWRILPDSTNSTGVIRLDDVRLDLVPSDDLAVDRVEIRPGMVLSADPFTIGGVVRNAGRKASEQYEVAFFLYHLDGDRNDIPAPFHALFGPRLEPGETDTIWAPHDPLVSGQYIAEVCVWMQSDANRANDTARVEIYVGVNAHSLVVNEIMYAPAGDEPEWFELWNVTTDSVSLAGWTVSDHTLVQKPILAAASSVIPPGGYAIVANDPSFVMVHPAVTVPFFTADFPALNNASPDGPIVKSPQGITIDSVRYEPSWGGQGGRSLERREIEASSTDPTTWASCVDPSGSTPGKANSTGKLDYDLAITSIGAADRPGSEAHDITLGIVNIGRRVVPSHAVRVYDDRDGNEILEETELIGFSESDSDLAAGDSLRHVFSHTFPSPGEHRLAGVVVADRDQRRENDTLAVLLVKAFPRRMLIFNELMYEPLPGVCEWVELYNPTSQSCNVRGWTVADTATLSGAVNKYLLSDVPLVVDPGGYLVLAGDSTIVRAPFSVQPDGSLRQLVIVNRASGLGFSNDGDALVLRDASGATVDSLPYDPHMHNPYVLDVRGRSLEKISVQIPSEERSNWSTASGMRGGSPGEPNTIGMTVLPARTSVSIQPNPFSPDGDGWEDFCLLKLDLPFSTASVRVRIFDLRGRLVRTLVPGDNVGSRAHFIWDGLDDRGRRVAVGPYVVLVEGADAVSGWHITQKIVAVVARRL